MNGGLLRVLTWGSLVGFFPEYSISAGIPYKGILHWVHVAHGIIIAYDPLGDHRQCRFIDLPGEK